MLALRWASVGVHDKKWIRSSLQSGAPLSMGLSRQEYWRGLPFSSPGNLPDPGIKPRSPALQGDSLPSEPPGKPTVVNWKLFSLTLCNPMDYTVHGILQARILECEAFPFSRGSSQPMIDPKSPTLQADSLLAKPQGKAKNTGVGSLSLLQWIFPTQESNQGLLHCKWILYQVFFIREVKMFSV